MSWSTGEIEANGIRLHYTRTGGDKPPVVLAHGVTDSGLCWSPLAEALEAEYDLIMVDARGHGASDAPERGYGPVDQAADLAGVIGSLGLRRPAVLGHSMGAGTALALASRYQDLPGAILLEDPPPWWSIPAGVPAIDDEGRAWWRTWITGLKTKTRAELIAEQRAASPDWSDAELEPWADAKLAVSLNVLSLFEERTAMQVEWSAVLARIACPALLITADPERGALAGAEDAARLAELVPGLRVVHIPGAGHNVRREQFGPYLETVRPFLAEWAATR